MKEVLSDIGSLVDQIYKSCFHNRCLRISKTSHYLVNMKKSLAMFLSGAILFLLPKAGLIVQSNKSASHETWLLRRVNLSSGLPTCLPLPSNIFASQNGSTHLSKGSNEELGSVYYVSPAGNDATGKGTFSSPWFTLTKAWEHVSADDTVYMMGGIYRFNGTTYLSNKSGTASGPITICNYRKEHPVINYEDIVFTDGCVGLELENISYLNVKGIRICNINQPSVGTIAQYGVLLWSHVSNCTFEQVECDHIGGWGFVIGDYCFDDLFLNCDSHHNADPYSSDKFGWSDGFEAGSHGTGASDRIVFRGCRAWWNSDDGWDLRQADGHYTIDKCWSFYNGYVPDTFIRAGNGTAFKLGGKTAPATSETLRRVYHSLAFKCSSGFDPQPDSFNLTFTTVFLNCTAYLIDGRGFSVKWYEESDTLRNCIQYKCGGGGWVSNGSYTVHDHNTWDSDLKVSDTDFLTLDPAGINGNRQADGSLPDLSFLHLSPGSELIDAGTGVGLPYNGRAPDMGAFETKTINPAHKSLFYWPIIIYMLFRL
jgi:hypothetical protein